MFILSKIKNKPLRWLANFALAASLLLITLLLAASLLTPFANSWRDRLAKELSNTLNAQVTIDHLDITWYGLRPFLDLNNITISQPQQTQHRQRLERLSIGVDPWQIARQKSLIPNQMEIVGLSLSLVQTADGNWQLPGLKSSGNNQQQAIDWNSLFRNKEVALIDASLAIAPKNSAPKVLLDRVWGYLNTRAGSIQAGIGFDLIDEQTTAGSFEKRKSEVDLILDVTGDLNDIATWNGSLDIKVPSIDLKKINHYFTVVQNLESCNFAFDLNLDIANGEIIDSQGAIDLHIVRQGLDLIWKTPLKINKKAQVIDIKTAKSIRLNNQQLDFITAPRLELQTARGLGIFWRFDKLSIPTLSAQAIKIIDSFKLPTTSIKKLQPTGELKDVKLGWQLGSGIEAQAFVEKISWQEYGDIPKISNISALATYSGGKTKLTFNDSFHYRGGSLLAKPIIVKKIKGDIEFFKKADNWQVQSRQLVLNTADFESRSVFYFKLNDEKKHHLLLESNLKNGNLRQISRYLPQSMPQETKSWFEQAFKSGSLERANLQINGYTEQLFANDKATVFKLNADIKNADFSFTKSWPQISQLNAKATLDKRRLSVTANGGQLLRLQPNSVSFVIDDISKASMQLAVSIDDSPAANLMHFIQRSPLNSYIDNVASNFAAQGIVNGKFKMQMPLYTANSEPKFNGEINLKQVAFTVLPLDLSLRQMKGKINFTHNSLDMRQVQAKLLGKRAIINASTDDEQLATISIDSAIDSKKILNKYYAPLSAYASGSLQTMAKVMFSFQPGGKQAQISLSSKLNLAELDLPSPLNINSSNNQNLVLKALYLPKTQQLNFVLGSKIEAALNLSHAPKGYININTNAAHALDKPGISLALKQQNLDLQQWLKVLDTLQQGSDSRSFVKRISAEVDQLTLGQMSIDNLNLNASAQADAWHYIIDSKQIAGSVKIAKNSAQNSPSAWQLNLQQLRLSDAVTNKYSDNNETLLPTSLPPIEFKVDNFYWHDIRLQNISGNIKPHLEGLEVSQFKIDNPAMELKMHALWGVKQQHLSDLHFSATIKDAGRAFRDLGAGNLFSMGKGKINGSLTWQDALYAPSLKSLSGNLNLELEDGELLGVKPGIAALFAIFNIEALPKRLALNFRDMDDKGLTFNTMRGSGVIKSGVLRVEPFHTNTDMGNIYIHGHVDLVHQQLNLIAEINPDVTVVIPVAAGFIGGLPGVVGAFLFSQAVKAFSKDSDKVAQIWYEIKGTINQPQVASTKVRRIKDLNKEELASRLRALEQQNKIETSGEKGELIMDQENEQLLFEN